MIRLSVLFCIVLLMRYCALLTLNNCIVKYCYCAVILLCCYCIVLLLCYCALVTSNNCIVKYCCCAVISIEIVRCCIGFMCSQFHLYIWALCLQRNDWHTNASTLVKTLKTKAANGVQYQTSVPVIVLNLKIQYKVIKRLIQ